MNEAMVPPAPGIKPSSVPIVQPTVCARAIFFIIEKRGRRTRIVAVGFIRLLVTPVRTINSVTA